MSLLILSHTLNKPRRTVILSFRSSVLVLIDWSEGRVHAGLWLDLNNFGLVLWSFHFCLLLLFLHPATASPWREKYSADPPCFLHLWWHQSWGSSWPGQEVEQCASSRCASKTVSDQGQCRMEMAKIKTSRGPTFYHFKSNHFKPSIVLVFVCLFEHTRNLLLKRLSPLKLSYRRN